MTIREALAGRSALAAAAVVSGLALAACSGGGSRSWSQRDFNPLSGAGTGYVQPIGPGDLVGPIGCT